MRCTRLAIALLASCALAGPASAANPPADVCVELAGWLDQLEAKTAGLQPAPPGAAPQPGAQQQQPQQQQQQQQQQAGAGQDTPPRKDLNTAVEQARPADPQRPGGQDEPQTTSGISGPVTGAGPGAAGPQGDAQEASQSGAANPKPDGASPQAQGATAPASGTPKPAPAVQAKPAEPKAPPPDPKAVEQARRSAQAKDHQACRAVVRDMRLAGVALPGPLLALAALRVDYSPTGPRTGQGAASVPRQEGPAPGLPPIPPSGIVPGQPGSQAR